MSTEPQDFATPATSMPTMPHETAPEPTGWPKTVGIIAVVFGALGTLQGFCGLLSTAMLPMLERFGGNLPPQPGSPSFGQQMAAASEQASRNLPSTIVVTLLAAWLLFGGIRLLSRKPGCRTILMAWACCKIVLSIVMVMLNYDLGLEQLRTAPAQQGMPPGFLETMESLYPFLIGLSVLWSAALPVFLLIWFSRRSIKEEVATWSTAPA